MRPSVPLLLKMAGGATVIALVVLGASRASQQAHAGPSEPGAIVTGTPAAVDVAAASAGSVSSAHSPVTGDAGQQPVVRLVRNAKPAPAFSITTFDGRVLTPATLKGKVVIVNFWATWCGPCRAEIPAFIALQQKYADRLVILGVSEDEAKDEPVVRQFVAANHMIYANGMHTDAIDLAFGGTRGIQNVPTSFVIDVDGNVVQRHVGLYSADVYENEVRVLLNLPVNAAVERYDDDGHVSLENGAEAKAIPGIDLNALTSEQRKMALQRLNAEMCTCGCKSTLAQCRIDDPSCETSLPLAKKIVAEIIKTVK